MTESVYKRILNAIGVTTPGYSPDHKYDYEAAIEAIARYAADNGGGITGILKVSSTTVADMKTSADTTLYIVPAGKLFIPSMAVVRNGSTTLAGATGVTITDGSTDTGLITSLTAVTANQIKSYYLASGIAMKSYAAGSVMKLRISTGATDAAANAKFDLFGYLITV